ncbi:prolyl oligopeptidase family serine peptidase [Luteimonas sp. BDR2-5]|uniref:prolyl oligopeptidase family serine peptidase n=1 Tax=Proluteimonas luteida TaxID=2878685 RepID=UPI001E539AE3|nr:prolyl oligopeptidase family serine peptidase [Luteimonas sp. BDR2-5]MCD9026702.1 prolyl oligopeptidase family serine peptidase [Luteimonas sp. BDR2-5]
MLPVIFFGILDIFISMPVSAAGHRLMTVDDMMQVEGLAAAVSDPNGRWLIFERLRPYDQSDDFTFRTYAAQHTGHQLWRYNLKAEGAPEPLPGLDPVPHSYLQGFSQSGSFLAVMQYRLGGLSLAAYDMSTDKAVMFEGTPAYSRDGAHNPVWISDDELMFAALPEGTLPELTSVRVHTGRTLAKAWEDAWRGDVVTASEVRTVAQDASGDLELGSLVRANARTGQSEVVAEGLYADLRISPDRRYLAALAISKPRPTDPNALVEDDPRRYRLALFNLETGNARMLAPELEFFPYTIAWAPDGRHLAAFGWTPNQTPHDGRFYVIDAQSGSTVRYDHVGLDLTSERERGWLQRPERVSFLGDGLAVFARRIPAQEDQAPRFTYKDVRQVGLTKPDWYLLSPDDTSRNLTADLPGVSGIAVHAGNGHLTVAADDGVYRLHADGQRRRLTPVVSGRFTLLQSGTFATRSSVIRPEFGDEAILSVTGDGTAKIVMVDLRDGHEDQSVVADAPSADATPLAGSLAAGKVLFRAEEGPVSRLLLGSSGMNGAPREIARINPHFANIDLGTWKTVSYQVKDPNGGDPQMIESCVLLPPGYKFGTLLPLVVEVYPNAAPTCQSGEQQISVYTVNWSPYLWSGKGYAYARLTTPRALTRTKDGPIAGMPAAVDAGVDALVKERFVDPNRVAIIGYSQGGISALYAGAYSEKFRAVIAMNSWADLFSHYFGPNGIYSYIYGEYFGDFMRYDNVAGSDFGIGRTPFEDPGTYIRNSPMFLAPRIDAPVMLVHSDMDSFSMYQFDEMFGALSRAGKDVRYVRYWGEGHGPSSPANIRDLWRRMSDFLTENGVAPQSPQLHDMN